MSRKTAALAGATGMTGHYLLEQLLNDDEFDRVRVIVRRPFPVQHPKIEVKLVDFNDYESLKLAIDGSDVFFCTIGTTQKKVAFDRGLYRKIDYDIPVRAARICQETGCTKFIIVSSVGADLNSRSFYLRLKGETEAALQEFNPGTVHILQPSFLLGQREEKRFLERLASVPMIFISSLLTGPLKKYRPIAGKKVAAAMLTLSKTEKKGLFRYTYPEIKALSEPGTAEFKNFNI